MLGLLPNLLIVLNYTDPDLCRTLSSSIPGDDPRPAAEQSALGRAALATSGQTPDMDGCYEDGVALSLADERGRDMARPQSFYAHLLTMGSTALCYLGL